MRGQHNTAMLMSCFCRSLRADAGISRDHGQAWSAWEGGPPAFETDRASGDPAGRRLALYRRNWRPRFHAMEAIYCRANLGCPVFRAVRLTDHGHPPDNAAASNYFPCSTCGEAFASCRSISGGVPRT
jgi:hypothetical protein